MNSIIKNNEKSKRYLPHELKTRENAVKTYRNGNSIDYVCRKYHISRISLWRWMKKYYGTFEAQAHGKAEGITVKMTCYMAEFDGELKPDSEIQEMIWLDYSNLNVKISPVDQLIFKDLFDKGLIK